MQKFKLFLHCLLLTTTSILFAYPPNYLPNDSLQVAHKSHPKANNKMKESIKLFDKAQEFLKSYRKFMPEAQVRELIHQKGIKTFSRPKGIPENFKIRLSGRGAGMEYVDPTNNHLRIKVMPGKPHSPFPYQKKPYVVQIQNGKALDKFGNKVAKNAPESHMPLDEFVYRN